MKRALLGGFVGLLAGCAIMLYFGWVFGLVSASLSPPRIERFDFSASEALMLGQILLAGALAGSITYASGRCGLGAAAGILAGFAAGLLHLGRDEPPWDAIGVLGTLLPVTFAGALACAAAAWLRMQRKVLGKPI